jgi:hypothetical protein
VWLREIDPAELPYLRESFLWSRPRTKRPIKSSKLVGYSTLRPGAPRDLSLYDRRVWWLKPYDPYGAGPREAVETTSIQPRRPSRLWGGRMEDKG